MSRAIEEWIGATDDTRAPPRVRDRIMKADSSCHLCSRPIVAGEKWDMDHVKALINGGENRESNLRPAHRKCHVKKSAADVAEKAKVAAIRKKHVGITRPAKSIKSAPFPVTEKAAKRQVKPALPPRQLYRSERQI